MRILSRQSETAAATINPHEVVHTTEEICRGSVQVIYGASMQSMPLAGLSAGEARKVVEMVLSVDPKTPVLINGRAARRNQAIVEGDVLEFVHHAGEKGASHGRARRDHRAGRRM